MDQYQITRKDGRHHAGAKDSQANRAEVADNFLRQSAREFNRSIPRIDGQHLEQLAMKLLGRNCSCLGCSFCRTTAPRPRTQTRILKLASCTVFFLSPVEV